jgi:porin
MFAAVLLLALAGLSAHAQDSRPLADSRKSPPDQRSFEDLNLAGAAVTMPSFADTILGVESGFRQALFSRGIALRANVLPRVSVNLLESPVPAAQQSYIGHRLTWITGVNLILTADLRQLKLRNAQLNIGGGWRWTTWNPAGPKTISLSSLYLYKMWREHRVEMKAGYMANDVEFVGMQLGGSLAIGAQGVYAVLPFQAGMSFFPLTAPSLNVRVRGPRSTYVKMGAQRSLDAAGALAAQRRNQSGFRFAPHGDRLLLINEAGYLRASGAAARYLWIRAGYLHNETHYTNRITGQKEDGNYCAYALADYQLGRPKSGAFGNGLYAGVTVMTAPSRFNAYDRYYEARVYRKAPFQRRPGDVFSVVAAYRGHSRYVTESLIAQGRTAWRNSPSLTASYSMHVSPGNYLTAGLGYVRGAAITPRVDDTLAFTVNWGLYF